MTTAGFEIRPGVHPIVPIMFSRFTPDDATLAQRFARAPRRGDLREGVLLPGRAARATNIASGLGRPHPPHRQAVAAFTGGQVLSVL
jgi:hypothetical protein